MTGLMHVVGPLVRLMGEAHLTWDEREQISNAIFETRRQWKEMQAEKVGINQACGQQAQAAQAYGFAEAGLKWAANHPSQVWGK